MGKRPQAKKPDKSTDPPNEPAPITREQRLHAELKECKLQPVKVVFFRAAAMSAAVARSFIDSPKAEKIYKGLVKWVESEKLEAHLTPSELKALHQPLGKLDHRIGVDLSWKSEGLAVLAWALKRGDMPPLDEAVDPSAVAHTVHYMHDDLSAAVKEAALRTKEEIVRAQQSLFAAHWRVVEFGMKVEPLDFVAFAETAWFGPLFLEGLPLARRDLAANGVPISALEPPALSALMSTAFERHRAINWLCARGTGYDETPTDT